MDSMDSMNTALRGPCCGLVMKKREPVPDRNLTTRDCCLEVLERTNQPAWVFSAEKRSIVWSSHAANVFFGRDLLLPEPPTAHAAVHNELASSIQELRQYVEEAGGTIEFEWMDLNNCTCGGESNIPGFPVSVKGHGLLQAGSSSCRLVYSPIIMSSLEGKVCCLVQLIKGPPINSNDDIVRVLEMHNTCPIFRYMFDRDGKLLNANEKALRHSGCQESFEEPSLWRLFELGEYESPQERENEYVAAMKCVFEEQMTFRCQQQRFSRKNPGQKKWVELEMWPMIDPVTKQRAVQVSQMSLTRTKKVEVALKEEKEELQQMLSEKEMLLSSPGGRRTIQYESPMEKLVKLFDTLMEGGPVPDKDTLMKYRYMITSASNLGYPAEFFGDLLEDGGLERDVGLSIMQQLGVQLGKRDQTSLELGSRGHSFAFQTEPDAVLSDQNTDQGEKMRAGSLQSPCTMSSRDFSTTIDTIYDSPSKRMASPAESSPFSIPPLHLLPEDDMLLTSHDSIHLFDRSMTSSLADMEPLLLISPTVVPVLERILHKAQEWDFDVFELDLESQGNPLSVLSFFLLKRSGLSQAFSLDEVKLAHWLRSIENSYQNNHYHNRIHAADVTHSLFVMLTLGGLHKGLSRIQFLAPILAAIVHDVDHPGKTNDFLVAIENPLAMTYNDMSPLENHHVAHAFKLLKKPENNFMHSLDKETYRAIRSLLIELVVGTDMKRHFDILSQFQMGLSVKSDSVPPTRDSGKSVLGSPPKPASNMTDGIRQLWIRIPDEQMNDAQHTLKLKIALKVADLSHLASPRPRHRKWVDLLQQEFFCQGDKEKELNMEVSPLMDRAKCGISSSQLGFFEFVAIPLYKSLVTAYRDCQPMMDALEDNYNMWEGEAQGEEVPTPKPQVPKIRRRGNTI